MFYYTISYRVKNTNRFVLFSHSSIKPLTQNDIINFIMTIDAAIFAVDQIQLTSVAEVSKEVFEALRNDA